MTVRSVPIRVSQSGETERFAVRAAEPSALSRGRSRQVRGRMRVATMTVNGEPAAAFPLERVKPSASSWLQSISKSAGRSPSGAICSAGLPGVSASPDCADKVPVIQPAATARSSKPRTSYDRSKPWVLPVPPIRTSTLRPRVRRSYGARACTHRCDAYMLIMVNSISPATARPRRPSPILICRKCLKRAANGHAVKRALKSELKAFESGARREAPACGDDRLLRNLSQTRGDDGERRDTGAQRIPADSG